MELGIAYLSPLWLDPERTFCAEQLGPAKNVLLTSVSLSDIRRDVPNRSPSDLTLDYLLGPHPERATRLRCSLPVPSDSFMYVEMSRFLNHFFNMLLLASDFPLPELFAMVDKPGTSDAGYTGNFQRPRHPVSQVQPADLEALPELDRLYSSHPGGRRIERAVNQLQKAVRDEFGRASFFDSLVETAIGIESLFNDGDAEVTYTLSMRVAGFNGTTPEARLEIFHFLRGCYALRSQLVHGNDASKKTFDRCFKKYVDLTHQDTNDQAAFKDRFRQLLRE